jgi:hypothetical protein
VDQVLGNLVIVLVALASLALFASVIIIANAEVVLPLKLTHFLETRGDAFSPERTTSLTAKARACYAQLGRPNRSSAWGDRCVKERQAN